MKSSPAAHPAFPCPPVTIRIADIKDAPALLSIYSPYVEETAISFEYTVPTAEEFACRIGRTLEHYPYLVAVRENRAVGYAYASAFKERAAYGWSAETSIYVARDARGTGAGTKLYEALEHILSMQHIINVNACITYPNPASISFHEKLGYKTAAHFTSCGYKLGRWWDMVWMEKMLGGHPDSPSPFVPFPSLNQKELYLKNAGRPVRRPAIAEEV